MWRLREAAARVAVRSPTPAVASMRRHCSSREARQPWPGGARRRRGASSTLAARRDQGGVASHACLHCGWPSGGVCASPLLSSLSSPASTLRVPQRRRVHVAPVARSGGSARSGAARRPRLAPVSRLGQQARAERVPPPRGEPAHRGRLIGACGGGRRVERGPKGARGVREWGVSLVSRWLR